MNRRKSQPETVRVRLLCILSGKETFGVGQIVALDPANAERLIAMGAAERV